MNEWPLKGCSTAVDGFAWVSPRSNIQRQVGQRFKVSEIHKAVTVLGNLYLCLGFCSRVLQMHGNIRYHVENSEVCSWHGSGLVPRKWPGFLLMKVTNEGSPGSIRTCSGVLSTHFRRIGNGLWVSPGKWHLAVHCVLLAIFYYWLSGSSLVTLHSGKEVQVHVQ